MGFPLRGKSPAGHFVVRTSNLVDTISTEISEKWVSYGNVFVMLNIQKPEGR